MREKSYSYSKAKIFIPRVEFNIRTEKLKRNTISIDFII